MSDLIALLVLGLPDELYVVNGFISMSSCRKSSYLVEMNWPLLPRFFSLYHAGYVDSQKFNLHLSYPKLRLKMFVNHFEKFCMMNLEFDLNFEIGLTWKYQVF